MGWDIDKRKRKLRKFLRRVNVRPKGVKTLKGDCSTRCLAYCLDEDYLVVRDEQHLLAESKHEQWNGAEFWDTMLRKRGWKRIYLAHPTVRYKIAEATKDLPHPLATSSSGHVCPTFEGKIIDLRESQLGRVDYVVCCKEDYKLAK